MSDELTPQTNPSEKNNRNEKQMQEKEEG